MKNTIEIMKLLNEEVSKKANCNLCKEANFGIGNKTGYGAIIYKGDNKKKRLVCYTFS